VAGEAVNLRSKVPNWLLWAIRLAAILVVVVILWPHSGHPPEARHRRNCRNNLKQIALGIAQYYDDHTNQMPRMDSIQHLAADIAPYIGNSTKLFVCPSDKTVRPATDISNVTESSYAIVTNAVWQSATGTPMLFDKFHPHGLTVLTGSNTWSRDSAHQDGGNVLYNDGHVDWNRSLNVGTNRYPVVND